MKTAKGIMENFPNYVHKTIWKEDEVLQLMKDYDKELLAEVIKRISDQSTSTPEEGEEDYRPGKYMAIGMLYEFKDKNII